METPGLRLFVVGWSVVGEVGEEGRVEARAWPAEMVTGVGAIKVDDRSAICGDV